WQATTFLVGDFQTQTGTEDHPIFTVADGLVWVYQSLDRNAMVRKMQVMKMRGQAPIPGLHTFRITTSGLQVFSRLGFIPSHSTHDTGKTRRPSPRLSIGVPSLDKMLSGGIPAGYSMLVVGPSGSGK